MGTARKDINKIKEKKITKKKSLGSQSGVPEKEAGLNKTKAGDEIDALFDGLKQSVKKKEIEQDTKSSSTTQKGKKIEGSKDDIFGTEAENERKRTEEGYAIYTEAELGFGKKGGDTDLCPFDCDCCF